MKLFGRVFAVLAVMVSSAAPVMAADARASDVAAPPQWTSDQVRAARSPAPENALVFDLRTETTGAGAPTRTTASTVTLTPTYTYVAAGPNQSIDDYTLCRTFAWSAAKPTFTSLSCYAVPASKVIELANRRFLAGMLAHIGKAAEAPLSIGAQPYWSEAELGVQDAPTAPLTVRKTGDTTQYRLGDEVVVRLTGVAARLTGDEPRRLVRFLARDIPLHPQPRRDLGAGVELPARMEIEVVALNKKQLMVVTISNVRRAQAAFPLPVGLESDLRTRTAVGDTPMARGVRQTLLAIDGRSAIVKPTPQALLQSLREASSHGRAVETLLRFMQFTQQYPSQLTGADRKVIAGEIAPLVRRALQDPEAASFLQASALSGGPQVAGDRPAAAAYLAHAADLDAIPFGTFRYVTFANLVRISPGSSKWDPAIFKAMPSPLVVGYWTHIAAYPWANGAFKDAGDTYLTGFDTPDAWLAYDLGRAVDPDWRSGPMAYVAHNEDTLRSRQPDFF